MPTAPAPYDVVLDAEGHWCMVLEPGAVIEAFCPDLGQRVVLEQPVRRVEDSVPFLRVQNTSRLLVALLAWHACEGRDVPERVKAEIRAALDSE